ncbi:MAG: hypothetical protein JWQ28_596, partial [Pedobacter sp.]|nr:hypothetical protein [Pedobacter sp.]
GTAYSALRQEGKAKNEAEANCEE